MDLNASVLEFFYLLCSNFRKFGKDNDGLVFYIPFNII